VDFVWRTLRKEKVMRKGTLIFSLAALLSLPGVAPAAISPLVSDGGDKTVAGMASPRATDQQPGVYLVADNDEDDDEDCDDNGQGDDKDKDKDKGKEKHKGEDKCKHHKPPKSDKD